MKSQFIAFTDSLHLVVHFLMEREKEFLAIVVNFRGLGTKKKGLFLTKCYSYWSLLDRHNKYVWRQGISMGAVESIWSAPHFRLINGIDSNSHILAVFRTCSKPKGYVLSIQLARTKQAVAHTATLPSEVNARYPDLFSPLKSIYNTIMMDLVT
jgi:hypothetical protein